LLGTGETAKKLYDDQLEYINRLETKLKAAASDFSALSFLGSAEALYETNIVAASAKAKNLRIVISN
jgi:hypothetical protein